MINELKGMAIFAQVIKKGSFRAAAKELSLSPSVVSYHISLLEKRMGAALIYRSTRHLSLTNEGKRFYHCAEQMMEAAKLGVAQLGGDVEPFGQLTLSLPTALCQSPLINKIAVFAKHFPKVNLALSFTDNNENIIEKGVDIALRAGELEDSSLKVKKLGVIERMLVCAPVYYATHPVPNTLDDIISWHWIKLKQLPNHRTFCLGKNRSRQVKFAHQVSVDNVEAISYLCQQGLGLATLATYQANPLVSEEKLVHVLPDWKVEPIPIYALWAANVSANSLTKKLLTYLSEGGR